MYSSIKKIEITLICNTRFQIVIRSNNFPENLVSEQDLIEAS